MTKERRKRLAGQRIGILGKGGSGKSTVSVLLAKALRRRGYAVVLLDADSTNIGLADALGVGRPPHTLIDHFGGMVFSGGSVTCPVDDPTPLADADFWLDRLPEGLAARSPDGIWLLEAGKMGPRGPGAGCDGPIAKIARDVRIHGNGVGPVTVVDFKAGLEDSARGVITGLDWAVVVVDPTLAAVQAAADTARMVNQIRAGGLPATRHLEDPQLVDLAHRLYRRSRVKGALCVLNRITDDETEQVLRARLAEQRIDPVGVIHDHRSVAASWLRGRTLDVSEAQDEVWRVSEKLETADAEYAPSAALRVVVAGAGDGNPI